MVGEKDIADYRLIHDYVGYKILLMKTSPTSLGILFDLHADCLAGTFAAASAVPASAVIVLVQTLLVSVAGGAAAAVVV
jgi:hypothetical protein